MSDLVCLEHGLSVIKPKSYRERTKRTEYPERESIRDRICQDIDEVLRQKPKTFDEMLLLLQAKGYEYKYGKNPAVKGTGQNRFVRFSSLGEGYSAEELQSAIAGNTRHQEWSKSKKADRRKYGSGKKFDMLIDIQSKIAEGKNGGYVQWAKRFNVKQASKAIVFLQEHDIHSLDELAEKTEAVTERFRALDQNIKSAEKRLQEIAVLKKHIMNYSKTREVYNEYRKSVYSRKFYENNKDAILLHKAAKKAFDELGVEKIPKIKDLNVEYAEVLEAKKKAYAEYREARQEMKDYQMAQEIAAAFLSDGQDQDKRKSKNKETER